MVHSRRVVSRRAHRHMVPSRRFPPRVSCPWQPSTHERPTDRPIMDKDKLFQLLDGFKVETPSWGYADTGTRFGKFLQPAAASTVDEKLADAGIVHKYTGCCPTVALHVLWDFSMGVDATETAEVAKKNGVRIGSINPNLFQDQMYKFGSAASPNEDARHHAGR